MAAFNFHRRKTRRWWYTGATLVVAAFFAVVFVGGAFANTTATLTGSTFEGGDGNLTVDVSGHTDWCTDFPAPAATATCTTPIAGLHTGVDLPSGTGDNSFGQGTKEDNSAVTVVHGSIPPNKSDLTRFYEASAQGTNNDVFLYLAWERTNNLGNANMDFEIDQNGTTSCPSTGAGSCTINRTNGDVLVTYDFGGSGTPTLGILRWLVAGQQNPDQAIHTGVNTASECFSSNTLPCWGDQETLNATNSQGAVDTGASGTVDPLNPTAPRTIVQNGFGEAAIDLTAAGVINSTNSCTFGGATTFLKSRSSSAFTSEIKDFISPVKTPIFTNCGAIKITKTSSKAAATPLAGATFEITGPNSYDQTFTTDSNGVICVDGLTNGNYTVTETAAPTGYAIDDNTGHTIAVSGGSCPSSVPAADQLTFTDTPLTDITATATSEVTGGTQSTITCQDSSNTDVGNSPQGPSGSPSVAANGLAPGTYTCTIVVDP